MVVDDEWCLIGSCNWDVRSFRLNFELCLELYDPVLAGSLVALMQSGQGRALTLDELHRRGLPTRLWDAALRAAVTLSIDRPGYRSGSTVVSFTASITV